MAGHKVDLFEFIGRAFNKQPIGPDVKPPVFMMHRFLASDQMFAPYAAQVSRYFSDPWLAYGWWVTALPRQGNAPRFRYPTAKSTAKGATDPLVEALQLRYHMNRDAAMEAASIINLAGLQEDAAAHLGVQLA